MSVLQYCSALRAETLNQALARAARVNPDIKAGQQNLLAIEENLDLARSSMLPSLDLSADMGRSFVYDQPLNAPLNRYANNSLGYNVNINQKLYDGGRTRSAVNVADANILAARENYRATYQNILLQTARAYIAVARDQAIKRLRRSNRDILKTRLEATRDRFKAGVVTRTDISTALSRLSAAISAMQLADSNLQKSRADYVRYSGGDPVNVVFPIPRHKLPAPSLRAAIRMAMNNNPQILAAIHARDAARFALEQARADRMPDLSLNLGYDHHWNGPGGSFGHKRIGNVTIKGTLPLYHGGSLRAKIRQASYQLRQKERLIEAARNQVRSNVVAQWGMINSARARINSAARQIEAAAKSLKGIRDEEAVGQRSVLDVLDAERELLDAREQARQARADYLISYFSLLTAMGRMTSTAGAA